MINKKNMYQRDDKTMENIKKKLYEVKKISVAFKVDVMMELQMREVRV
jgi:hypothetical protein